MDSGQVEHKARCSWKPYVVGFLLGIAVVIPALVIIPIKWGPQGKWISLELYSGKTTVHQQFLWKHWEVSRPIEPHAQWAIDHQDPVNTWYVGGSSTSRTEWFGPMMAMNVIIYMPTHCVYGIYSLNIPEEEKIKLLYEYHRELDVLKQQDQELKQQQYPQLVEAMKAFNAKWEQQLLEKLQ